jgi:hypothetical protein
LQPSSTKGAPGWHYCWDGVRARPLEARLLTWTGRRVIADDEVFLMNPDEPASLDDRYFGPIPSAGSSAKPSRYRPSRSCSAAIPVQAANENSSARLLHPPPHSVQLSVRSRRLDSRPTASRPQSSSPRELGAPKILLAARAAPATSPTSINCPRSEPWTSQHWSLLVHSVRPQWPYRPSLRR